MIQYWIKQKINTFRKAFLSKNKYQDISALHYRCIQLRKIFGLVIDILQYKYWGIQEVYLKIFTQKHLFKLSNLKLKLRIHEYNQLYFFQELAPLTNVK